MKKILKAIYSLFLTYLIIFLIIFVMAIFLDFQILWTLFAIYITGMVLTIFVISTDRMSEVKLAWVMFILFVPFIGACTFLLLGRKFKIDPKQEKKYLQWQKQFQKFYNQKNMINQLEILNQNPSNNYKVFEWLNNNFFTTFTNQEYQFLSSGTIFFKNLIKDLKNAKKYILMTYYLIQNGELLDVIKDILIQKMNEGIKIYIIYDHGGSIYLFKNKTIKELINRGINICAYTPVGRAIYNGKVNYRNHRKDTIIDGQIGYTGGVNISDLSWHSSVKQGFYNDKQIRLTGPIVGSLELIFCKDWLFIHKNKQDLTKIINFKWLSQEKPIFNKKNINSDNLAVVINQEPNNNLSLSFHLGLYLNLFAKAKKRIWISTPYFIPPREIINALILASQSGIDVRLMLPGITDRAFVLDFSRFMCKKLFDNGVKIYELNGAFTHEKMCLIDNDVVTLGTTNFDYRSFLVDKQTLVLIKNQKIANQVFKSFMWNWDHATKWQDYIIKYKSWGYRFSLKVFSLINPIL